MLFRSWPKVRPLLDEVWFLQVGPETRVKRLVNRRMETGEDEKTAREWVLGVDMLNAEEVLATQAKADAYLT